MEHIQVDLTAEQRNNLQKLADYLLSGELKADFDMSQYSDILSTGATYNYCGTVGCAAGHGPHAGIAKIACEKWSEYVERVFIGDQVCTTQWRAYKFCFGGRWAHFDNTPEGAGRRILHMLANGVPVKMGIGSVPVIDYNAKY